MTKTPVEAIFALEERVERLEKELAACRCKATFAVDFADVNSVVLVDEHGNTYPVTMTENP